MNYVNFIGYVGNNPVAKATQNQKNFTTFSIAVKDNFRKDTSYWIDCVAWNKLSELILQHVEKGDRVCVTGQLINNVVDKDDKKTKYTTIEVDRIEFLSEKKKDKTIVSDEEQTELM